jgi:hypothetical protein
VKPSRAYTHRLLNVCVVALPRVVLMSRILYRAPISQYRTQKNATPVGEVFQHCESVILSNSTIAVSYQHWITITISTVPLYCTSHPHPLLSARSRVHLCPEKEPIAVHRLTQVQTQNTSQNTSQNIHRVQTRVHKTDMIVITHEDPEHVPTQDLRLLGPFSQEQEVKPLPRSAVKGVHPLRKVAPDRSNHHQPQYADDIAAIIL